VRVQHQCDGDASEPIKLVIARVRHRLLPSARRTFSCLTSPSHPALHRNPSLCLFLGQFI
jgi:hypothetical protein